MCWKHRSVYERSLPNNHSIKTTTQPPLELNLFKLDWNTDVKHYVHPKLQNKCQENKNNTPVGMHSQKRSALHRAGSDSHVTVTPFGKMREKKKQNSKFHYNTENSYIRQTTDVEAFFSLFSESHSETKGMMHSNKGGNKKEKKKKEEHQRGHLEISNTA